ncbi:hypothetical protein AMTR_s00560p00011110 [Amborella trichopoda]|uniref:Cytochrome P450 n=1 Tax=Amborella trichopoda TaxID=13333 RepID=W1PSN6_AMBTC|nr:hypothetical protein AMTR_s00560p00011110 [Amborella trichopoda]
MAEQVLKVNYVAFSSRSPLIAVKRLSYGYSNVSFSPYGTDWLKVRKILILELLSTKKRGSSRFSRAAFGKRYWEKGSVFKDVGGNTEIGSRFFYRGCVSINGMGELPYWTTMPDREKLC